MNESCIQIEELARVVALPAGDPGRAHLDNCARCQSLAEMLSAFAISESPAAASPEGSADAAPGVIPGGAAGSQTAIPAAPVRRREPHSGPPPASPRMPAPSASGRRWFEFTGAQLAGAAVALVVVNAVVMVVLLEQIATSRKLARVEAEAPLVIPESVQELPGAIEFSWGPVPNATAYRVVLLDEERGALSRLEPTTDTSVRLAADDLPRKMKHGRTVSWAVEALSGGELLLVSPAHPVRLP